MGVFDFLFGTPDQTGQLDPETKRARDFLLNQMLQQYSAGPINVPSYQAMVPQAQYAGSNALLGSLGLGQINAPQLPTTTIGGMQVATSLPLQQAMESEFAERNPAQYDFLRSFYMDPVTGELGTRSFGYTPPEEETSPEEDEANRRRRRRRRSRRNRERIEQQRRNMNPANRSTGGLMSQLVSRLPNRVNARTLQDASGGPITRTSGAVTRSRFPVARGTRTASNPRGTGISSIFGRFF